MLAENTLTFRLSEQQKRLWDLQEEGPLYTQGCVALPAALEPAALSRAALRVVERHEILRTTFRRRPGVRFPFQVVGGRGQVRWREVESGPDGLDGLLREERSEPLDPGAETVVRLAVVRNAGRDPLLVVTLPSLCADPWTLDLFVQELLSFATAGSPGSPGDLEPLQYVDFTSWQEELRASEEEDAVRAREHWQRISLESLGSLSLAGGPAAPASGLFDPRVIHLVLEPEEVERLEALAQERGAGLPAFALAAWMTLLWRLGAGADLVLGRLAKGRTLEDLEGCLGPIARVVPLAVPLANGLAFADLWQTVENEIREGDRWPELGPQPEVWPFQFEAYGISGHPILRRAWRGEPFELKLVFSYGGGLLAAETWYDHRRYTQAEAKRLADRFAVLLRAALHAPGRRIGALELLTGEERRQLVVEPNRSLPAEPLTRCVHELFAEEAARRPERIAVVSAEGHLTAGMLEERANRLANYLRSLGVGPEVRVAIFLERSYEAIVALLGILKAGGAYVPLDPVFPRERIAGMLQQAQAAAVLTQERLLDALPDHAGVRVCLDTDAAAITCQSQQPPESGVGPENLSYVLFTSGSTGRPKGVAVEHRHLLHYLAGLLERLALPAATSAATVSTLAADLGNTAIFPALARGGTLHVLSRESAADPAALADSFRHHPVDLLKIVPSHLAALLLSQKPEEVLPRRVLVLGGEASGRDLIEQVRAAAPGLQIFNHYGPTETTVGVMTWRVPPALMPPGRSRLPLGRPLPGSRVFLLNPELQPVPAGVAGEIYIGGGGVARGYLEAPDQTAERFIPDPFAERPGQRLYRTGDLGRFQPEGELEFLGRADGQVKISGFRIELGEIETLLRSHPDVWECAVVAHETPGSEAQLVAYVVLRRERQTESPELRSHLAARLPHYMLPAAFVTLEALPLTPNGKLDRRALPAPGEDRTPARHWGAQPRTLLELELIQIWEDLLNLAPIGVDESFFEIGGHSLLAVRMMAQIEKRLGCSLPLATLYRSPTIRRLADLLESDARLGAPSPLVPIQPHGARLPFFCIHPMGGEVLCFYHLSRALGQDQPFYGLQAPGLMQPAGRSLSIPEMAEQYLAAIRQVVPDGPYLIGGHSFGSKVAFEIAHQIRRTGGQVALLALLDGGGPGKVAQLDSVGEAVVVAQTLREEARRDGSEFSISFQEIERREPEEQLSYVLEQAKLQGRLPAEVDLPVVQQFLRGLRMRQQASAEYVPDVYPDPIVYFRSTDQDAEYLEVLRQTGYDVTDPTRGWARFAGQSLEILDIPGQHDTLLLPPHVQKLAESLRAVIDRVQSGGK